MKRFLAHPVTWIIVVLIVSVAALRFEGRLWWCACRTPTPFSVHVNSSHNSQHLLDPYSFSHLLHGIIFFWALKLILGKRLSFGWMLLIALVIEAGWEILENSPMIIDRYRAATASLGYSGDSVVNSTGDILSCALGFVLARRIGWRWSIAVFVAVELVLLFTIRDNLTLNVIMLIHPIEAIKQWQMGVIAMEMACRLQPACVHNAECPRARISPRTHMYSSMSRRGVNRARRFTGHSARPSTIHIEHRAVDP